MKKRKFIVLGFFLCLVGLGQSVAQNKNIVRELQRDVAGQGMVVVHQDYKITEALTAVRHASERVDEEGNSLDLGAGSRELDANAEKKKMLGYRIQIYAGNNSRQARQEAYNAAARVKKSFPDLAVYTHFQSPRWVCRVGNFKTMEEAKAAFSRLYKEPGFNEYSIIKSPIIVSKNDE